MVPHPVGGGGGGGGGGGTYVPVTVVLMLSVTDCPPLETTQVAVCRPLASDTVAEIPLAVVLPSIVHW